LVVELEQLHGKYLTFNQRADVAFAAQQCVGERVMAYARELTESADGLVLAGGVALNCTINASVAAYCRARNVELVIPPPASDTGVAIGAAAAAVEDPLTIQPIEEPFLGLDYPPHRVVAELRGMGANVRDATVEEIASLLIERSLVLGWFEGRSEIGPRALGKRSVIARPDNVRIRDRVNFLKSRESWRPLAPSLTAAEFGRSFENSVPSRHMLINATNSARREKLSGVIHADGTSRPQVVDAAGPYRTLLATVGEGTGCEAVICTSFNMAGEPIVYSPAEALASATAMNLDGLAGDGWIALLTPELPG
jgi:carbamoyltransferase